MKAEMEVLNVNEAEIFALKKTDIIRPADVITVRSSSMYYVAKMYDYADPDILETCDTEKEAREKASEMVSETGDRYVVLMPIAVY